MKYLGISRTPASCTGPAEGEPDDRRSPACRGCPPRSRAGRSSASSRRCWPRTRRPAPGSDRRSADSWPARRGCASGPRTSAARRDRSRPPRGGRTGRGTRRDRPAGSAAACRPVNPAARSAGARGSRARPRRRGRRGSARVSCQSSRSISVVTLFGRPRSTPCNWPGSLMPRSSRAASPNIARPDQRTGQRLRCQRRRVAIQGLHRAIEPLGGSWRRPAASAGRECPSPILASRRCAAAGLISACAAYTGILKRRATRATRRTAGSTDVWVTENSGRSNRLRMIVADRVSMMSNTLGMTVRPTRLRSTPVRSRKTRWPASTNCGEPSSRVGRLRVAQHVRGAGGEDPDRVHAHRRQRPVQALGDVEVEVHPQIPRVACRRAAGTAW